MLISRIYAGAAAISRRPEASANFADFYGSTTFNSSQQVVVDTRNYYSSYYSYEVFDGNETNIWVWSYSTEILTSDIDTTPAWVDLLCFKPTVLNGVKLQAATKGLPHRIAVYGSNTGAFTSGDRNFVLEGTIDLTGMVAYDWTGYFTKTTPNIAYKFYRIYLLDYMDFLDDASDTRFHGWSDMAFHIQEEYVTGERFVMKNGLVGSTASASSGTAANAFSTSASGWIIDPTTFIPDSWLMVDLGAGNLRKVHGWRIIYTPGNSYGRGLPGTYSLYASNTGAFAGEETVLFSESGFNVGAVDVATGSTQRTPWQVLDNETVPFRYFKWVFHTWNYMGGTEAYPGISSIRLGTSLATYSE
jgi:hypothetical protein